MAEYTLIDSYLEALQARLRWHRDVENLVAEAKDHLYSAVERSQGDGAGAEFAQRRTLDEFGDSGLVADAHATTPRGGLALPTDLTTTGGTVAMLAAGLWLVVVGAWWIAGALAPRGTIDPNASAVFYVVGWAALIGACVSMIFVIRALDERHGGHGAVALIGVALAVLSSVASVAGWIYAGWAVPLTVATLVVAAAMLERGIAPRIPTLAFGGGFALGALTWVASRLLAGSEAEWAGVGFWGSSWTANSIALTVGAGVLAFGLFGLGRWLRSEEPAQLAAAGNALPS